MLKLCRSLLNTTEQRELSADWDDLQTLKWAQTVDPHQSEECELLLETYSMQVCLSFLLLYVFHLPQTCSTYSSMDKCPATHIKGMQMCLYAKGRQRRCLQLSQVTGAYASWHKSTCNHQHHLLHPGAVLALHDCMLQRIRSPDLVNCNALVQGVTTVAYKQLRVLSHIPLELPYLHYRQIACRLQLTTMSCGWHRLLY